uniref:Uncharacterized protein n=1 Tax=Eptatretus burgeri TaxID=7764 RepID=A0A8C4NBU2_EPTBU
MISLSSIVSVLVLHRLLFLCNPQPSMASTRHICSVSNSILVKLSKSRLIAHLHSFVPLSTHMSNQLRQSLQSHPSFQGFKTAVHHHLRCGIRSTINKYRETSSVMNKPRTGSPKKPSNKDDRHLKIISLMNREKMSVELTSELAEGSGVIHSSINNMKVTYEVRTEGMCCSTKTSVKKMNTTKRQKYAK